MTKRMTVPMFATILLLLAGAAGAQEFLTNESAPDAPPAVAAVDSARAWSGVRVTTDEGWNLTGVTLQWLSDGSRVRITRDDGSWRDYLPWTVRAVHGADGADLTAEIAAARPEGPRAVPGAGVPDSPSAPSYNEIGSEGRGTVGALRHTPRSLAKDLEGTRPFRTMVTLGGGYGSYAGDWFNGFESSPSLQATARFGVSESQWITLGYCRQGGGTQSLTLYDLDGNMFSADIDLRIDEFILAVGTNTKPMGTTAHIPYAEFGLAVLSHHASTSVAGAGDFDYSETKLGALLRFGGLISIGKNQVLDLGLGLINKAGFFSGDDEPGGTIFEAHVGFGWVGW